MSCGARLAPFDIEEVRDITMYDELSLDTVGDKKTALFRIMSDTDPTFNFLISMIYTQLGLETWLYVCPFAGAHADGKSLFISPQGRIVQGGTHLWHFSIAQ